MKRFSVCSMPSPAEKDPVHAWIIALATISKTASLSLRHHRQTQRELG
jgi:hypothetical protein